MHGPGYLECQRPGHGCGRAEGLRRQEEDPLARGIRRREVVQPVQELAAGRNRRGLPRIPGIHQGPVDHARGRWHPFAERRAAPVVRPVRLPAPGALVQGRALARQGPEKVDMVIFRENTEDIYAGIEFEHGSEDNKKFKELFKQAFPKAYAKIRFPETSGIGFKPVSQEGTERLFKAALEYAVANMRRSVTIVHKGNIQKFTEGAFRNWAYALAESGSFKDKFYTWEEWGRTKAAKGEKAANEEQAAALKSGRILVKDAIADIALQQVLTRPDEFDVLATTNLNGDYLSDALAAQVGGIGIAPGANINYVTGHAVFEATHGTAPKYADLDQVNPGSVILSGEMMLRYLGWTAAADAIISAMDKTIGQKTVTYDFARLMEGATKVKCSEFGDALIRNM